MPGNVDMFNVARHFRMKLIHLGIDMWMMKQRKLCRRHGTFMLQSLAEFHMQFLVAG